MRSSSYFEQHSIFASAAAVASHASFPAAGFRPRDFRFRLELFLNWMDSFAREDRGELSIQNVQVIRYLDSQVEQGILLRQQESTGPNYSMSAGGLLQMLTEIAARPTYRPYEQFFFAHYFVSTYRDIFDKLFKDLPMEYPPTIVAEIHSLLEADHILQRQLRFAKRELDYLKLRSKESKVSSDLAKSKLQEGGSLEECVSEVEKHYPYQLNNQKPLSELFREIPEEMRYMELTDGFAMRALQLFDPQVEWLTAYVRTLERLAIQEE